MAGIKIELNGETLTYAGEQFHTTPKEAKETLEKYGIAIIPNRLTPEECKQMNEGMWKTAFLNFRSFFSCSVNLHSSQMRLFSFEFALEYALEFEFFLHE